jgi:hypothetical protein
MDWTYLTQDKDSWRHTTCGFTETREMSFLIKSSEILVSLKGTGE